MKKYACYQVHRDEESGEWWKSFEGHIQAETPEKARELGMEKFGYVLGEPFQVFEVGTRVKLRGFLGEEAQTRLLRDRFNELSRDEQDAYAEGGK